MLLRPYRDLSKEERMAALASWVLLTWGVGHLIVIDLLPLLFGVFLFEVDASVLQFMHDASLDFSLLGQTNLFLSFFGLSLWLALSFLTVGAINLLLANSDQVGVVVRRRIYVVDILATASFATISAVCFFALPVIGGALSMLLFLLALRASHSREPGAVQRESSA